MAFVSTVCSRSHGGGINAYTNANIQSFASIVAHELGHNLGMNHDDGRNCKCDVNSCIMNSGATGSRNFSSCSADDFEKLILGNGGSCLLNIPRPDEAYSAPYCGNKLVDVGEECDCGSDKPLAADGASARAAEIDSHGGSFTLTRRNAHPLPPPQECEKDPCCEAKTCKLKSGAQCADGVCCKNCQFLPGGTVCRGSIDECDLAEYCNGSSAICQSDVFKQNGHPCRDSQAYCYNGKCQHYDGQCQAIFGPKAKAAPDLCFKDVNSKGDRFGNCGYLGHGYKKCESRNAKCGKLQCENVQSVTVFGIEPSIIKTPIAGTKCWGVDFLLGSDVPDPGMVNEGTRCEENKVCLNYQCVSVDALKYDCDVQKKCHGHGVCNSNKNCHCDNGWAPPNCEAKGYGGSIDSGPTWNDKDTSTRDGLLVFFFLVLPLLVVGLNVFFRRNELRRRFCRKKRSQGYEASSRPPPPSGRGPPPRSNSNNIVKDGHNCLSLWDLWLLSPLIGVDLCLCAGCADKQDCICAVVCCQASTTATTSTTTCCNTSCASETRPTTSGITHAHRGSPPPRHTVYQEALFAIMNCVRGESTRVSVHTEASNDHMIINARSGDARRTTANNCPSTFPQALS
ncbi:hypothetical protein JZ751_001486 [Albula glossodonta]|uniref:Disintegrin and metalloproteinase domain-containing protein 9 n=1 Tax=Albula glossodonta TaxID=121402 RepID=A0A8T2PTV8_9TELE|nr:hypothetical protein JZ751_001486 [Albula glossodonta]